MEEIMKKEMFSGHEVTGRGYIIWVDNNGLALMGATCSKCGYYQEARIRPGFSGEDYGTSCRWCDGYIVWFQTTDWLTDESKYKWRTVYEYEGTIVEENDFEKRFTVLDNRKK